MKKSVALSSLFCAGSLLTAGIAPAQTISNTTTSAQTLASGTLTVTSTGTINVGTGGNTPSGQGTVAVTVTGTSTIMNSGTIEELDTNPASAQNGRAIRLNTAHETLTIYNYTGALITAADSDAIQVNKPTDSVVLYNYGTVSSTNFSAGGAQAIDWNAITSSGSNTLYNYSTGTLTAREADAVRPGVNGFVYNSGTIKSTTSTGSSSDGIDGQTNSGITIVNASSLTAGAGATNLIEGGRHGITGGNTGTNTATLPYQDTANPTTPGLYTMSVTNNAGGTIQGDNGSGINIDGFGGIGIDPNNSGKSVTFELINVTNAGTITGHGVTGDGDGIDIDGAVILNNTGTITSLNSTGFSEGVTVGGGTIVNGVGGVITGTTTPGSTGVGRGITIAGVDKAANDAEIPIQSAYAYHTGTTTGALVNPSIDNSGIIRGSSESGIAVLGTTGGGLTVTITNRAAGTIEGNNTGVSEASIIPAGSGTFTGQSNGQSLNQATIELDDTSNTYVINDSGTITQDNLVGGTAVAMHGVSNTLNVAGGAASIVGDVSGNTAANSTLNITPGNGNSFTYNYGIHNFSVNINSNQSTGTVTLNGASDYTGSTTLSGGITYVNNTSGSGTGSGAVQVNSGATLSGTGTIKPSGTNAITVAAGGKLTPGGVQNAPVTDGSTNAAKGSLTIDTTNFTSGGGATPNAILKFDSAQLTFALGSGDGNSGSKINITGGTANTVAFSEADPSTVIIDDLVAANLTLNSEYVLIHGDNTTYTGLEFADASTPGLGLRITGGLQLLAPGSPNNFFADWYNTSQLYLDGDNIVVDVVPEPETWAMLLGGFAVLIWVQGRRRALLTK